MCVCRVFAYGVRKTGRKWLFLVALRGSRFCSRSLRRSFLFAFCSRSRLGCRTRHEHGTNRQAERRRHSNCNASSQCVRTVTLCGRLLRRNSRSRFIRLDRENKREQRRTGTNRPNTRTAVRGGVERTFFFAAVAPDNPSDTPSNFRENNYVNRAPLKFQHRMFSERAKVIKNPGPRQNMG